MTAHPSPFHSIASTIRVRQIQSPVSRRDGGEKLEDLEAEWERLKMNNRMPPLTVELVEKNGRIVGWWDFDDYFGEDHYGGGYAPSAELRPWLGLPSRQSGETGDDEPSAELLEEIARPIVVSNFSLVVTGDTPVIEVIERLWDSIVGWLFVVENGDVTGVVSYKDLFGPIGSLCLLALCFELEAAALRLCQAFSRQCWESLSENRRQKAFEVFQRRNEKKKQVRPSFEDLLECSTFIDKCSMINKCKLLVDWSGSKVRKVFKLAEDVRNACAHPPGPADVDSVLELERLPEFVRECRLLTESILMVTPQSPAATGPN